MIDRVLLFPYYLTLKVRNSLYDKGLRKSRKADVPTVCIGNVTAGGTGKTPHVEMMLRMLLDSDEWGARNIAVLSRGYKRESKGFQQVTRDGSATMFGDEPMQVKKKFPAVTVAVDKDRIRGCNVLAHPEVLQGNKRFAKKCWDKDFPAADLILLDDAYQYRKLKPSLSIVLVDYNRPVTKDKLIPFGSLRDLGERIYDADMLIVTKCPQLDISEKIAFASSLGVRNYQAATCDGTNLKGRKQTILFTSIKYGQSMPVYDVSDPRYIYSKKVILFTGIAKDTPLRNYLSDFYKITNHFVFPDHHRYTWSDIQKLVGAVKRNPTAAVATTEKDSQRVADFNGMPQAIKERLFMVPISVDFLTLEERELFRSRLVRL